MSLSNKEIFKLSLFTPNSVDKVSLQGRIQDFHGGGGGAKDYLRARILPEHEPRSPLRPGPMARLRALETLGVFNALSCYLSLILEHSDTKYGQNINYDTIIVGRERLLHPPPPGSATALLIFGFAVFRKVILPLLV